MSSVEAEIGKLVMEMHQADPEWWISSDETSLFCTNCRGTVDYYDPSKYGNTEHDPGCHVAKILKLLGQA